MLDYWFPSHLVKLNCYLMGPKEDAATTVVLLNENVVKLPFKYLCVYT